MACNVKIIILSALYGPILGCLNRATDTQQLLVPCSTPGTRAMRSADRGGRARPGTGVLFGSAYHRGFRMALFRR